MEPNRVDEPELPYDDTPHDLVDEAEEESFPASDPPARTVVTGVAGERPSATEAERDRHER